MTTPPSPLHAAPDRLTACPNCGSAFDPVAPPPYCPQCGQEARLHPPSVAEFAHEFVGHYIALEGPLWKTLALLVAQPGRLTQEYLAGRRRRYVQPLRLYLSASFLFFLAFKLLPSGPVDVILVDAHDPAAVRVAVDAATRSGADARRVRQAVAEAASAERDAALLEATPHGLRVASAPAFGSASAPGECARPGSHCGRLERRVDEARARWAADPVRAREEFVTHWLGAAPYAVFLMLPAFAAVVGWTTRGRRMVFGEHLVFGLHLHAFWFLAALASLVLPEGAGDVLFLVGLAYLVLALRRVYGGSRLATAGRTVLVVGAYGLVLMAASLVLALLTLLR